MASAWLQLSRNFDPDKEIPDLSGKVILVTGGNIGLGYETILQLCKHNPKHIYLAARTENKARDAIASIQKQASNAAPITWLPLDLTSFASIKDAANTFNQSSSRLDLLINNAGIMACAAGLTKEGYEIQFGTNYVGHSLLTKLLLPTLLNTAKEPGTDVRIINLSSEGLKFAPRGGIVFDSLTTEMTALSTWTRYGSSKLANVHFTQALAEKYPQIKSVAVHPGAVHTNLTHGLTDTYSWLSPIQSLLGPYLTMPARDGAKNQLWAAASSEALSGRYYTPVGSESKGTAYSRDKEQTQQLWDWTEKELKEHGF